MADRKHIRAIVRFGDGNNGMMSRDNISIPSVIAEAMEHDHDFARGIIWAIAISLHVPGHATRNFLLRNEPSFDWACMTVIWDSGPNGATAGNGSAWKVVDLQWDSGVPADEYCTPLNKYLDRGAKQFLKNRGFDAAFVGS